MSGWRGRHGGLPAVLFPEGAGTGYRLHGPQPRRSPRSHRVSFPAEPGLAPEGLRGCGAGLTLMGTVRPGEKGRGSEGA